MERGGEMRKKRRKICKNASITITNFQYAIQVYACMSSVSTTLCHKFKQSFVNGTRFEWS